MHTGTRRSVSKKMGDNTASVTVESIENHWLIRAVHWDAAPVVPIPETFYPTAELAFEAGTKIARSMCVANTDSDPDTCSAVK